MAGIPLRGDFGSLFSHVRWHRFKIKSSQVGSLVSPCLLRHSADALRNVFGFHIKSNIVARAMFRYSHPSAYIVMLLGRYYF